VERKEDWNMEEMRIIDKEGLKEKTDNKI